MEVEALSPVQHDTLAVLRDGDRREWDRDLRPELRDALETALAPQAAAIDRPLMVGKHDLARVLACEAHQVAETAVPFEWTVAAARGTVAHKAVELSVLGAGAALPVGATSPLTLVDAAIDRLADDPSSTIADFLLGLDDAARTELRGTAADVVGKFRDQWPPLQRAWRPQPESAVRAELCDGRIVLRGKVDLALGAPTGRQAGRLLVDLKTGGPFGTHADDLRLYALLDALRMGVPPFRLATHYLDSGRTHVEDVGEATLTAALRRTVAAVSRLLELRLGLRSPATTPNPACRWCPARETCDGARAWAASNLEAE